MKWYILFILIIQFLVHQSIAQETENAFNYSISYKSDFARNFIGGIEQGNRFLGNLDLELGFDFEESGLWKGGLIHAHILNSHGKSLSAIVGDYQVSSNIEANPATRFYQLWYSQTFNRFSIIIGQHDLNSEFVYSDVASNNVNSSFGIQAEIACNVNSSIFPVATLGMILKYQFTDRFFLTSIYDGHPGTEEDNPYSLKWSINKNDGYMNMNEFKIKLENYIFKFGTWYNSSRYNDKNQKEIIGRYGAYFISDYKLYKKENNNLEMFVQLGISMEKQMILGSYFGAGLKFSGQHNKKHPYNIGIAFANAQFSNTQTTDNQKRDSEKIIELFYKLNVYKNISLQPDFQYIINPGVFSRNNNAFIGLLRFELNI